MRFEMRGILLGFVEYLSHSSHYLGGLGRSAVLGQRWRQQSPIDQDQDQGRLDRWFWGEEKDMPSIAECEHLGVSRVIDTGTEALMETRRGTNKAKPCTRAPCISSA